MCESLSSFLPDGLFPLTDLESPCGSLSSICFLKLLFFRSTLKVKLVQKETLKHGWLVGVFYQSAAASPALERTLGNLKRPPPPTGCLFQGKFEIEGLVVGAAIPPYGALIFTDQSTKLLLNVN